MTFTATVTAGATGKVTFYDGSAVLGISSVASGQAKFTTSLLLAGTHNLHAHYSGDGTFLSNNSGPLTQLVTALPANGFVQIAGPAVNSPARTFAPTSVVRDFNADGKADLAIVTETGFDVTLGNGDGTFQSPVSYAIQASSVYHTLAVGDFNGDGVADIAVGTPDNVQVLPGKADGSFGAPIVSSFRLSSSFLTVADLNGDGKADLVGESGAALGNGDGTFRQVTSYPGGGFFAAGYFAAGDFNGDGKPDLVRNSFDGVDVLIGNGDGTFRPAARPILAGLGFGPVVVADFNGDGYLDIAAAGNLGVNCFCYSGDLAVLLGNGDGTFRPPTRYSDFGSPVAVGDINGDGKPDLVLNAGQIEVRLGNGDGTFQPPAVYSVGNTGSFLSPTIGIGDFNNDGRTDIVAVRENVTSFLGAGVPDLTISMSHTGTFAPGFAGESYTITVSNLPFGPTAGTVLVTDTLPPGVSAIAMNGPGWNCVPATLSCTRSDSLEPGASYPPITIIAGVSSNVPGAIVNAATVSGGGDANPSNNKASDTIVIRPGSITLTATPNPAKLSQSVTLTASLPAGATGQVTFWDGSTVLGASPVAGNQAVFTTAMLPAGSHLLRAGYNPDFTSPYGSASTSTTLIVNAVPANGFVGSNYPFLINGQIPVGGPGPVAFAIGDFNGDGKLDLVGALDRIIVFPGNGDGGLGAPHITLFDETFFGRFGFAARMLPADLNGDGKTDLVLVTSFPDGGVTVSTMLGKGDGTFQQPVVLDTGSSPVAADFNGDGIMDVGFISGVISTDVSVFLGNRDGTFASPILTHLSDAGSALATADFNGDGKPDLAVVLPSGIAVLRGNGDGSFQPAFSTTVAGGASSIVAADFNADGKADLAIGNQLGTMGTVLLGKGDGTFLPTNTSYPGSPLAAGDLNGDGKTDLVTSGNLGTIAFALPGKGDGSFLAPINTWGGGFIYSVWLGDLDGDGRTDVMTGFFSSINIQLGAQFPGPVRSDLAVWRPSTGTWYVNSYNHSPQLIQAGSAGDVPLVGRFENSVPADYGTWRPSDGTWNIVLNGYPFSFQTQFGALGDIPFPADFNGDGLSDVAVWRPSTGTWITSWGINLALGRSSDIPVAADFDGDGKVDTAVWRPSTGTWYVVPATSLLTSPGVPIVTQWGLPGDIPVAADFDGDGKADYAVWRPSNGTWYIIPSTTSIPYTVQWGLPGDIPVPHDYDLDGKTDIAVWRPSNGTWYIIPSATWVAYTVQWGAPGDIPAYKPAGY